MADQDLITVYLAYLERQGYSEHSRKAYELDLRQAEREIGVQLADVDAEALEDLMAMFKRKGMKGTTVRRKQASLRGFYRWATKKAPKDLRLQEDPTGNLEAPKVEDRLPVYLQGGEVDQLRQVLAGDDFASRRDAAAILCLLNTGMRAIELERLDVAHVDLQAGTIRVLGKGNRERELPILDDLAAALRRWLDVHPTGRGALFVTLRRPHKRLGWDGLSRALKLALGEAGLQGRKVTCHKLRHTFATRLINRKVSIEKLQKLLGHRRIDTTTIYAHVQLGADLRAELETAMK